MFLHTVYSTSHHEVSLVVLNQMSCWECLQCASLTRSDTAAKPLITAVLIAGIITFIIPAGGRWISAETSLAAVGGIVSPHWIIDIFGQFIFSFVFEVIIASAIYFLPAAVALRLERLFALQF